MQQHSNKLKKEVIGSYDAFGGQKKSAFDSSGAFSSPPKTPLAALAPWAAKKKRAPLAALAPVAAKKEKSAFGSLGAFSS